jgi:hypothetical protein
MTLRCANVTGSCTLSSKLTLTVRPAPNASRLFLHYEIRRSNFFPPDTVSNSTLKNVRCPYAVSKRNRPGIDPSNAYELGRTAASPRTSYPGISLAPRHLYVSLGFPLRAAMKNQEDRAYPAITNASKSDGDRCRIFSNPTDNLGLPAFQAIN